MRSLKAMMKSLSVAGCAATLLLLVSGVRAEIKTPVFVVGSDLNAYGGTGPDQLVNSSGLSTPVNDGDSLESISSVTHLFGGSFNSSWVTEANAPDYFATGAAAPTFVWDLGSDVFVDNVVLWQYENSGGNAVNTGNHARLIDFRFNTEAQGADSFAGPVKTIDMAALVGAETLNLPQVFDMASPTARYVQMAVTDNHYGDPDGLGVNPTVGGDRVGLGELRFDVRAVPEPSSAVLLLGGLCAVMGRRRRRR
jgi:hypothetical protein